MTIEREISTVHTIYSDDPSRPTITLRNLPNGNTKATQASSWITWTDGELIQFVNALAELRPDVLCDAPDEPQLGELYSSVER